MKIGLASENKLPKAYVSKTLDDGEQVTLQAGSKKLTIATNSFQSVANILSVFAPNGNTTLEPGTTFYIRDGFSDLETTVTANALADVAATLALFAVKPGKFVPVMKDEEEEKASDQAAGQAVAKPEERKKQTKSSEAEPVAATAASIAQETVTAPSSEKLERKKPGRKAAAKTDVTSAADAPKRRGRKPEEQAAEPAQVETPVAKREAEKATATIEMPAKRRGRPPKNRAVTDAVEKNITVEKKTGAKKSSAPAPAATVTPMTRTHSSGGPFPAAMTANHKNPEISGNVPDFIKALKAFYIIGDNEDFRFDFTALEMDPAKRRSVVGPATTQTAGSTFGYEVKTKAGEHIGWIIIEAENKFVMAGIPEMDISSHRNIEGPITKTGIAIANKIASIRAKAA
jgi:hypothetical protein